MRYYFHLREVDRYIVDDEGLELDAPEAARKAAVAEARSIIAGDAMLGRLPLRTIIEVEDENGNRIIDLPFKDAVYVDG